MLDQPPMPTPRFRAAELPPSSSSEVEVPDFAQQVQAWMAAKAAAEAAEPAEAAMENGDGIQFQPPPPPTSPPKLPEELPSMEATRREPTGCDTTWPMRRDSRSRSRGGQNRDRRSHSRDRQDRAAHSGRGSRSKDRRSRSRGRQNTRDREQLDDRVRDDRGLRRSRDRGRDAPAARQSGQTAIAITQGYVPSRIWLQNLMLPFGRLEYSHTGSRINPERDPPWVRFASAVSAEDAMTAISAGLVVDGNGVPVQAAWKKVGEKGSGKSKEITSRDLYWQGPGKVPGDNRGSRDTRGSRGDRRRSRRSSTSSSSSR